VCKTLINQSWRVAGTGEGEATRARTMLVEKESMDGDQSGMEWCNDRGQEVTG
jgi:hypothetical protein